MKERPILFSGPMVRALLNDAKMQTRRVMNPQPVPHRLHSFGIGVDACIGPLGGLTFEGEAPGTYRCLGGDTLWERCPFGVVGDRLWVRESAVIAPPNFSDDPTEGILDVQGKRRLVQYIATDPDMDAARDFKLKVTPSIFMPRWASRIMLELTDVRAERVQSISENDAIAEGIQRGDGTPYFVGFDLHKIKGTRKVYGTARDAYRSLWDSLNAKRGYSWDANPWVWALTFRRVTS